MSETVTLTHPDGHGPIRCGEASARTLIRQGWQRDTPAESSTPPEDDAAPAESNPSPED